MIGTIIVQAIFVCVIFLPGMF